MQSLKNSKILIGYGRDAVVLLDKKTKKIDWILGGASDQFALTDKEIFFLHHSATLDEENSKLILFDNGNLLFKKSRVIELFLDQKKIKNFTVPYSTDFYTSAMGSVEKSKNGSYSVGNGKKEKGAADFFEIFNNEEVFKINFKGEANNYRVYRLEQ